MSRGFAYAELKDAPRGATFVASNAPIMFGDRKIAGRIAVADDGDQVIAGCDFEDVPLCKLARSSNLAARADVWLSGGAATITRLWLYAGHGSTSWVRGQPSDALATVNRRWRPRLMLALMQSDANPTLTIPVGSRPAGDEICRLELKGEIDANSAGVLVSCISAAAGQTIDIQILNSNGGLLPAGYRIADALARHDCMVVANVVTEALSAAVLPLLMADVRTMQSDARLMIHQPVMDFGEGYGADDLRSHAASLDKEANRIASMIAARTGNDRDIVSEWMSATTYFSAAQALELGFVNQILHDQAPLIPVARRARFAPINGPFSIAARGSALPPLLEHGRAYPRGSILRFGNRVWRAKRDSAPMLPGSVLLPGSDPVVWESA